MMADTREQAAALNGAIRDRLLAAGHLDDTHTVATNAGERLGVGDRVATRRNDRDLGVTNRDTWTITAIGADGSLTLRGRRATDLRTVPAGYAREHVELAYATTVYGAQGETTSTGHLMLGEHTSAASAYVAMTRGRRRQRRPPGRRGRRGRPAPVGGGVRPRTGPTSAPRPPPSRPPRTSSATAPSNPPAPSTRSSATCGRPGPGRPTSTNNTNAWPVNATPSSRSPRSRPATHRTETVSAATKSTPGAAGSRHASRSHDLDAALTSETADLQTRVWAAWRQELAQAQRAAEVVREGAGRLGQHRRQVRDAGTDLTAFAARWRPAVPDLATDPAELADQVMWLHGRRVEDPINAFVARTVADAHPDADQIREPSATPTRRTSGPNGRAPTSTRPCTPSCAPTARPRTPATPTADSPPSWTNWQTSNATYAPPPHASMSSQASRQSGRSRAEDSTANTTVGRRPRGTAGGRRS